jgi:hypothetical protein
MAASAKFNSGSIPLKAFFALQPISLASQTGIKMRPTGANQQHLDHDDDLNLERIDFDVVEDR